MENELNLRLTLKTKLFEMTKSGIKTEDYREITPYWCSRLMLYQGCNYPQEMYNIMLNKWGVDFLRKLTESKLKQDTFKEFTTNTMTLGYPKSNDTERILKLEHKGIEIRTGKPEWGAEPNKLYFVIMHGSILNKEK
jgi:hypothetical protein